MQGTGRIHDPLGFSLHLVVQEQPGSIVNVGMRMHTLQRMQHKELDFLLHVQFGFDFVELPPLRSCKVVESTVAFLGF